jgi:hypothetical protein
VRKIAAAVTGVLAILVVAVAKSAPVSATSRPSARTLRFTLDGRSIAGRFPHGTSIAIRYPANWHVTTRRLDNVFDPHTLFAVSTYKVPAGPPDDCDGTRGRGRPGDGAFVLVKEVLDGASLRRSLPRLSTRPRHFRLPTTRTSGQAGCLRPPSVLYEFRVAKRAFYVWLSVGPRASRATRAAMADVLDGMKIARYARR